MIREWMGFSGRIVLGGGVETPGYVVREIGRAHV